MELCSLERCSSCLACYNSCPKSAIGKEINSYGAMQPVINIQKCKTCLICQTVCPDKVHPVLHLPKKAIALYTKDEFDKMTCSSGGAATTFSRYIISKGGSVFGATSVGGYPHFIKADNMDALEALKGSKYVYCDPGNIFKIVKEELRTGKLCLFIGTPCNVGGLLSFLKREYDNLITIDLICHGTPPFSYLKEHIESKVGDYSKVENFTFRGINDFHLTVFDKDKNIIYKRNQYEDEYFMAFMQGFIFRPVCYECQYAQNKRVSDITIGDFWNLDIDALNHYKGKISVALLNTKKSTDFFNQCNMFFNYEERDIDEAINGNEQLRNPSPKLKQREDFIKLYFEYKSVNKVFRMMGINAMTRKNKFRRYILYIPRIVKRIILSNKI